MCCPFLSDRHALNSPCYSLIRKRVFKNLFHISCTWSYQYKVYPLESAATREYTFFNSDRPRCIIKGKKVPAFENLRFNDSFPALDIARDSAKRARAGKIYPLKRPKPAVRGACHPTLGPAPATRTRTYTRRSRPAPSPQRRAHAHHTR